jgi:transposase
MILRPGGFSPALSTEALMRKVYVVRLTDEEREHLVEIVRTFSGASQRVRRAQVLLKADADGPGWTDQQIADAFGCRRQTVENVRRNLCERGFAQALDGVKRQRPPTPKLLDGAQEAKVIATRLGPPPKGYANWTLRLLARAVVELSIVDSISHETVRRTLKKTA